DNSIFVRRPNRAIQASKGGPCALFATEAERTVEEAIHEPLEAHRHLVELPAKLRGDTVNHLAAHHRFADRRFLAPLGPVLEEVENGNRKVVVGRKQPYA